jgi:hypothetical protein
VTDTLAAVQHYIDAFNDGDVDAMASVFDTSGVIIDGMAPHVWQGSSAAHDWYRDVLVEAAHHGASDYAVMIGQPLHDDVTGDRAYVVLPATMTFSVNGQQITQIGARFTVALRRLVSRWRITAWAWTKGAPGE